MMRGWGGGGGWDSIRHLKGGQGLTGKGMGWMVKDQLWWGMSHPCPLPQPKISPAEKYERYAE